MVHTWPQDSYGANLVAQLHGEKRWTLYPPSAARGLYPSRVPYEQSSVFSRVHVHDHDRRRHPDFGAVAHEARVVRTPPHCISILSLLTLHSPLTLHRTPRVLWSQRAGGGAVQVTLRAGEVLFVPRHWWHDVQTVSHTALSVNHWIHI